MCQKKRCVLVCWSSMLFTSFSFSWFLSRLSLPPVSTEEGVAFGLDASICCSCSPLLFGKSLVGGGDRISIVGSEHTGAGLWVVICCCWHETSDSADAVRVLLSPCGRGGGSRSFKELPSGLLSLSTSLASLSSKFGEGRSFPVPSLITAHKRLSNEYGAFRIN